jgi:hypothetical protein
MSNGIRGSQSKCLTTAMSSLPKAERAITLSTFVPQDIRDRRLLSLRGRLSVGRLRHKMPASASHVKFNSRSSVAPVDNEMTRSRVSQAS